MKPMLAVLLLVAGSFVCYADSSLQTDWSGGPGEPGPVTDWGSVFFENSAMDCSVAGQISIDGETLFMDSFNRSNPDNWGSPDIGGTYTYEYPDNADFSVVGNVGFIDDNSNVHDPKAISQLTEAASSYVCEFSWKYTEGHSSWLTLNNGPTVVVGVRQAEDNGKLSFLVDGNLYVIEDREGGVWKDYMIIVEGSTAQLYVDGQLRYTATCSQTPADNIRFVTNGNGVPSDNWFEDVIVYTTAGSAWLTSSILNTQPDPFVDIIWGDMFWDSTEPSGTEVSVQVRSSADSLNMGGWSEEIASSSVNLADYCGDDERYFQYRVNMETSGSQSPVFSLIMIDYATGGIGAEDGSDWNLSVQPCPSSGQFSVNFGVPFATNVEIRIFDLAGRCVETLYEGNYEPGSYTIQAEGLPCGTYVCSMRAGSTELSRRLVVVE